MKKEIGPLRLAMYPGSFNPWHEGHDDVLDKALKIFDFVYVVRMHNPAKSPEPGLKPGLHARAIFDEYSGLLVDAVKHFGATAVIRGLRNGHDLQYEMNQQYWNEDLGLKVPVVYFICDREVTHVSSSALRQLKDMNALRNIDRASRRG